MSKRKQSHKARRKGVRTAAKKGRRYTPREKQRALELAARVGVPEAAKRTGITPWSIYAWRTALKLAPLIEKPAPREAGKEACSLPRAVQVPEAVVKQVVTVWRNNPGFGPSQIFRSAMEKSSPGTMPFKVSLIHTCVPCSGI